MDELGAAEAAFCSWCGLVERVIGSDGVEVGDVEIDGDSEWSRSRSLIS